MKPPQKLKHKSPKTYSGQVFKGILLEPIEIPHFPDLTGVNPEVDAQLSVIRDNVRINANQQLQVRMQALIDHYNIQQTGDTGEIFFRLAHALARDFLPGFQPNLPAPTRRPKGQYKVGGEDLFRVVHDRICTKRETVKNACAYISRHNRRWYGHNPKALETAYHRYFREIQDANLAIHQHPVYGPLVRILGIEELLGQMKHSANKSAI